MPIASSIRHEALAMAVARPSKAGATFRLRIGRIDDDRRQAVAVERDGQRQADQAAAEDDDVRAIHARLPTIFPPYRCKAATPSA